jgi:hypothetical protein
MEDKGFRFASSSTLWLPEANAPTGITLLLIWVCEPLHYIKEIAEFLIISIFFCFYVREQIGISLRPTKCNFRPIRRWNVELEEFPSSA